MQNKVVRFVLDLDPRAHVGQEQQKELGLLSVKDRVIQLKLNQVFKMYHGLSPNYLKILMLPVFYHFIITGPGVAHTISLSRGYRAKPITPSFIAEYNIGIPCQTQSSK